MECNIQISIQVKDHLTYEKVSKLKGELLLAANSSRVDTLRAIEHDKHIVMLYDFTKPDKYIMRISTEGYVTSYANVDVTKVHKREKYRQLPNVYMRRVPKKLKVELGKVVVKSTLLKFYMDGDTQVYNADAFHGQRLDDERTAKKRPGMEVADNGGVMVNGRTETFYNVIPSYGLFHAVYRLNKQPKNKK